MYVMVYCHEILQLMELHTVYSAMKTFKILNADKYSARIVRYNESERRKHQSIVSRIIHNCDAILMDLCKSWILQDRTFVATPYIIECAILRTSKSEGNNYCFTTVSFSVIQFTVRTGTYGSVDKTKRSIAAWYQRVKLKLNFFNEKIRDSLNNNSCYTIYCYYLK